jgi:hypothetical protein
MDVAGIITAVGGVVALIIKVTGLPAKRRKVHDVQDRLEHLEQRLERAEGQLLGWASWAHDARVKAASHGVRLPSIPGRLIGDDSAIPSPRDGADSTDRTNV